MSAADAQKLAAAEITCHVVQVGGVGAKAMNVVDDIEGLAAKRYDGRDRSCYLFRPDQHVCARWRAFDLQLVRAAIARATCNE